MSMKPTCLRVSSRASAAISWEKSAAWWEAIDRASDGQIRREILSQSCPISGLSTRASAQSAAKRPSASAYDIRRQDSQDERRAAVEKTVVVVVALTVWLANAVTGQEHGNMPARTGVVQPM